MFQCCLEQPHQLIGRESLPKQRVPVTQSLALTVPPPSAGGGQSGPHCLPPVPWGEASVPILCRFLVLASSPAGFRPFSDAHPARLSSSLGLVRASSEWLPRAGAFHRGEASSPSLSPFCVWAVTFILCLRITFMIQSHSNFFLFPPQKFTFWVCFYAPHQSELTFAPGVRCGSEANAVLRRRRPWPRLRLLGRLSSRPHHPSPVRTPSGLFGTLRAAPGLVCRVAGVPRPAWQPPPKAPRGQAVPVSSSRSSIQVVRDSRITSAFRTRLSVSALFYFYCQKAC